MPWSYSSYLREINSVINFDFLTVDTIRVKNIVFKPSFHKFLARLYKKPLAVVRLKIRP